MHVIRVRNVNSAYAELTQLLLNGDWVSLAPRGKTTLEYPMPVSTVYSHPRERVLMDPYRDANPFFHIMEAVWIAAGRHDVGFLANFLPSIVNYSDDGETFNAAYGERIRDHYNVDQLLAVHNILQSDPHSRRAFWIIGDPLDLIINSKDIACNVSVFFKIRNGALNMLVSNRSNDAIWGAYGANAVQFSFLQELLASSLHLPVGIYTQVSDSFHVYDNEQLKALLNRASSGAAYPDPYRKMLVSPYPIVGRGVEALRRWLSTASAWVNQYPELPETGVPFFDNVLTPMATAFQRHRVEENTAGALEYLEHVPAYQDKVDWLVAAYAWLWRRLKS